MGTKIDLDAMRAARMEAQGEEVPSVVFNGTTFDLPAELPFAVVEATVRLQRASETDDNAAAAEVVSDVAKALFGERFKEFLDMKPSMNDVTALLEGVAPAYGTSSGESPASES